MITIQTGLTGTQTYIPEYGGNRKRAHLGEEYWCVDLVPANKNEVRALMRKPKGRKEVERTPEELVEKVLIERVIAVRGLVFRKPDGTIRKPVRGEDLRDELNTASSELNMIAAELLLAVTQISTLEEGLLGNLPSQSDTSHRTTPAETGDASNAGGPTEQTTD